MNANTIVAVVRALIAAAQTDQQIADTLVRMGAGNVGTLGADTGAHVPAVHGNGAIANTPTVWGDAVRETPRVTGAGQQPTVNYRVKPGLTEQRIREMIGASTRGLEVAAYLFSHPNQTKREIGASLGHTSPGVTMSALHGLQMRGVVESQPIPGAVPGPLQMLRGGAPQFVAPVEPVPAAVVRGAKRAYNRKPVKAGKRAR